MNFMPPPQPGDHERRRWKHSSLEGKIITLENLKKEFPENEEWQGITELINQKGSGMFSCGYIAYGRINKKYSSHAERIAYQCGGCKSIVVGPPEIVDVNTLAPLSGKEGYVLNCNGCGRNLDEVTTRRS